MRGTCDYYAYNFLASKHWTPELRLQTDNSAQVCNSMELCLNARQS
jgi:hypothetical protein